MRLFSKLYKDKFNPSLKNSNAEGFATKSENQKKINLFHEKLLSWPFLRAYEKIFIDYIDKLN